MCQALSHALYINTFNPAKSLLSCAVITVHSRLCTGAARGVHCSYLLLQEASHADGPSCCPFAPITMFSKATLPVGYSQPNNRA